MFETDEDGAIDLRGSNVEKYFVSGDSLYHDENGDITFPLGSYVIYETQASEGYLLSTDGPYITRIVDAGNNKAATEGDVHIVEDVKYVGDDEQVKRGDLSFEHKISRPKAAYCIVLRNIRTFNTPTVPRTSCRYRAGHYTH